MQKPKGITVAKLAEHVSPLSQSSDQNVVSHLLSDLLLPSPQQEAQQSHGYHCLEAILLWLLGHNLELSSPDSDDDVWFGCGFHSPPGTIQVSSKANVTTPPPK